VVPTFWWTVAVNLAAVWVGVLVVFVADWATAAALPLVSLAASVAAGLVGVGRARHRRLGLGALAGAAASAGLMVALLLLFFLAYFVLGGHELS
jgi:hypothetical protein